MMRHFTPSISNDIPSMESGMTSLNPTRKQESSFYVLPNSMILLGITDSPILSFVCGNEFSFLDGNGWSQISYFFFFPYPDTDFFTVDRGVTWHLSLMK